MENEGEGSATGGSGIVLVKISDIKIGENRRKPKQEVVEELAQSIETVGLLNPITISKDGTLIAGLHRLEACKLRGMEEIPARVVDLGDLERVLAEDDENVIRADYSELEKARAYLRRKEIYEQLHPETQPGGKRQSPSDQVTEGAKALRFTEAETRKTGDSERTIQRYCQIGKSVFPEVVDLIANTPIANSQKELLELGGLPENEQLQVAAVVQKNPELKVKEALAALKATSTNETPTGKDVEQIVTQLPPALPASTKKKTTKSPKKVDTTQVDPKPEPEDGAGQKATDNDSQFLPALIKDIVGRATSDLEHQVVVLIPSKDEMLLNGQPQNVHLGRVVESGFEQCQSEDGTFLGTVVLKVELSTDALSGSLISIFDGFITLQITPPVSEHQSSYAQPVSELNESPKARLIGQISQKTDRIDAKGDVEVECDCGHAITIPASELEWEGIEVSERPMGAEWCYRGKADCECSNCNADISVEITVWEYPAGAIEHSDVQVHGGILQKGPELEIKLG